MKKQEELIALLTEQDAPFRKEIEATRDYLKIKKGGFSSEAEMEKWMSEVCNNPERLEEVRLAIKELSIIAYSLYGLNESKADFVSNYLFFNKTTGMQEADVSVISKKEGQELSIAIHGGTTLADVKKAWATITKLEMKESLLDYKGKRSKPCKDLAFLRRLYKKKQRGMTYEEIIDSEKRVLTPEEIGIYIKRYKKYSGIS